VFFLTYFSFERIQFFSFGAHVCVADKAVWVGRRDKQASRLGPVPSLAWVRVPQLPLGPSAELDSDDRCVLFFLMYISLEDKAKKRLVDVLCR
jgi:hypothetical protein